MTLTTAYVDVTRPGQRTQADSFGPSWNPTIGAANGN